MAVPQESLYVREHVNDIDIQQLELLLDPAMLIT
jgi:hypothetical protein